jgi:hypothetical protein
MEIPFNFQQLTKAGSCCRKIIFGWGILTNQGALLNLITTNLCFYRFEASEG